MTGPGRDDFTELEAMFGRPRPDASARPHPRGSQPIESAPHDPPVVSAADVAAARKRRNRRRAVAASVGLVIVAIVGTYIPVTLLAPVPAPTVALSTPTVALPTQAALSLPPTMESAVSITGGDDFEALTGSKEMVGTSGGDTALPIASISKLISALVILERKPLSSVDDAGPTLTFSKADHDLYDKYYVLGASIQPMKTGSQMSERDVMKTMLIVSACNYAEAVSDWAFGSQTAFLAAARKWLAANGLSHTKMVEPTGLDARNTSTPGDLITLGKLAMANPAVARIVAQRVLTGPNVQGMANTNDLLGTDGITGIKTGTLAQGSDLLFSATLDVGAAKPLSVIGVILGGASHDSVDGHVTSLLASIKAGFHPVTLGTRGQVVGTYSTPWGASARMVLDHDASVLTWSDTPVTAKLTTSALRTGADGEKVGTVTWTAGASTVSMPLVLKGRITPPTAWWRLTHPFELGT